MSQLQKLLELDMPFGVIFSNSYLGADVFFVILESDRKRHDLDHLEWLESFSQPLLRELALSARDQTEFLKLKGQGAFQAVPLGVDGIAYELVRHPFRAYYHQYVLQHQSDREIIEQVIS